MSIYNLTEEHVLFQASVKKWTEQQLTPRMKELEQQRTIDFTLLEALGELGFLSAALPEALGGLATDVTWHILLLEELAKAGSTGFAQIVKQHATLGLPLLAAHFSVQIDHFEDLCTYSQVRAGQTTAVIVNRLARYVIVHNIDTYELRLYEQLASEAVDLVGWHTAALGRVQLSANPLASVQLSREESLSWQAKNDLLDAAILYGIAKTAADETTDYAKTRIQFDGPLTQFQVIRHNIVEQRIELEKLRHLLYVAAFNVDQPTFITQCFALRLFVLREVPLITDRAVQIHGGNGFMMEYNVQRYWRDSQTYVVLAGESTYNASEVGQLLQTLPVFHY